MFLVVCFGMFFVMLSMAEMASMYAISSMLADGIINMIQGTHQRRSVPLGLRNSAKKVPEVSQLSSR